MTLTNRIRRWWYWRQMAKIDRECRRHGHNDFGCYSVTGSTGDRCSRCRRIIWFGRDDKPDSYQAPTRLAESNWR
jgi:hypothetical protein